MENNFAAALDRFRRGEMIIVIDDHERENEGDLIMLAEHATTEKTAFMVRPPPEFSALQSLQNAPITCGFLIWWNRIKMRVVLLLLFQLI
jgi:hypothetical protein